MAWPSAVSSRPANGTPVHWRWAAFTTTPSGSTTSRTSDPNAQENRPVSGAQQLLGEADDHLDRLIAALAATLDDPTVDDLAGQIDDAADKAGVVADVEADDVARVEVETDKRGGFPDQAGDTTAHLLDESVIEKITDHVRDRGGCETADAGEIGSAVGAVAEQDPKDQAPVLTTGVLRHRFATAESIPLPHINKSRPLIYSVKSHHPALTRRG